MTRLDHSEPWRYECPRGHTGFTTRSQAGGIYCESCYAYHGDDGRHDRVRDRKTGLVIEL